MGAFFSKPLPAAALASRFAVEIYSSKIGQCEKSVNWLTLSWISILKPPCFYPSFLSRLFDYSNIGLKNA